jgi:hypothetical protein
MSCKIWSTSRLNTILEQTWSIWFFQFIFESILIPSNFSQAECCNCSELIVKYSSSFWNASFCFVPTVIHLVLLQFINILLSLHHNSILFKSSWTLVCISEIFSPEMCRWHGLTNSNFLFINLFSIKYLYFFIISSLFPYFNLFMSIFIQSYVHIKLHVSTLYRY